MKVRFQTLRALESLLSTLHADGWAWEADPDGSVLAGHREVTDEGLARIRLDRLGLLISAAHSIEFQHERRPGEGLLRTSRARALDADQAATGPAS
jgi:hypothetical protein